ncbi:MAG: alpha/beta hydrolase [Moorea sp. SIO2I5]|nr:alpha/beta hydrolase [Moorena sp. SIO2I5]
MKLILGGLVGCMLLATFLGMGYEAITSAQDLERYPPLGKRIDVGGYQLHINTIGEGSPTVVMEHGLGSLSPIWSLVQSEVAKFTQVCTYDRAGYGWSDPSPNPRTSEYMVKELHTLLTNAGVEGPYILVGHSLGGLNVRQFASQYPDKVLGLVLVDAVPANVYSELSPEFEQSMAETQRMFQILSLISRLGLLRLSIKLLGSRVAPDFVQKLPAEVQPAILANFSSKTFETAIAENRLMHQSAEEVNQTQLPNDLPVVVLSHGLNMFSSLPPAQAEKAGKTWQALQGEIAQLSGNGTLKVAQHSGHNIHIDQPQLVIDSIRQIFEQVRQQ